MSVLICPVCQNTMREINRNGVLIDACTQCRGVWLDRGELEKLASAITETVSPHRSTFLSSEAALRQPREIRRDGYRRDSDRDDDDDDDHHKGHRSLTQPGTPKRSKVSRFLDFFD